MEAVADSDSMAWLAAPRTMTIKERNSERAFEFRVVDGDEVAPEDPVRSESYALVWEANGQVAGFVSAVDIAEIRQSTADPSMLTILLKGRNPQAVCNTGGLQIVCIRSNGFAECSSYRNGLNLLIGGA